MVDKLRCESGYVHYMSDGRVLEGRITPMDIGIAQISRKHHAAEAKRLGYDLETIWGNLAYARHLFEREGDRPWLAPTNCKQIAQR